MEPDIERDDEDDDGVVVPESVLLRREQTNRYGSVEGLDDDELADPDELERQVFIEEWAPILALPWKPRRSDIRPTIDESGHVDWGAFGTVDFERKRGGFDRARYKAERLREQLGDKQIMLSIVSYRLPGKAKHLVLKYLRMGIIDLDHIVNHDMVAIAKLYLEMERLRKEIREIQERSRQRKQLRLEAWLERLG
jgi:hypothetical protein